MSKLQIAIVAASARAPGGQAVQAAQLLGAWHGDPAVDARLVSINPQPPRILGALDRNKYGRQFLAANLYLPQLATRLAHADVVHVFGAAYRAFLLAPLAALLLARPYRVPVVLNYRNGEGPDHLAHSPIARAAIRHADRVVVPSAFLAQAFAGFGLKTTAIANIVDLQRFAFRERPVLRPRLLSTRNLHGLYNISCTLRAFRMIQDRRPDATLTIAGDGPKRSVLEQLSGLLGLRGVRFLGRVAYDQMPSLYADHDVYVQTPDVDNQPNSVLEAFASGLPVVSTDVGGMSAMVANGTQGLLVPKNDHASLANEVLRLLENPRLARELTAGARVACERHTWPVVRDQWLRLYEELAAARGARVVRRTGLAQPQACNFPVEGNALPPRRAHRRFLSL